MLIKITCDVKDFARIEDLIPIQCDLKIFTNDAYQKLRKEIIDLGFSFPFFVWEDGGVLKLLDGTHRKETVLRMREEGIEFPELLPIVKILADDYSQAKRKLLAVTSSYAKITEGGLKNFVFDIEGFSLTEMKDSFDLEGINYNYFSLDPLTFGDEPTINSLPNNNNETDEDIIDLGDDLPPSDVQGVVPNKNNEYIIIVFDHSDDYIEFCQKTSSKGRTFSYSKLKKTISSGVWDQSDQVILKKLE
jgi:hypothetical protein